MKKVFSIIMMFLFLVSCKERDSDFYLFDCPGSLGDVEIDMSSVDIDSLISDFDGQYRTEMIITLTPKSNRFKRYKFVTSSLSKYIDCIPVGRYVLSCDIDIYRRDNGQLINGLYLMFDYIEIVEEETVKIIPHKYE